MTRTFLQISGFSLLLAICAALPWMILRGAEPQLRKSAKELGEQATAIAALTAENGRLSNKVVQASQERLSDGQLRELARLRAEMERLRQATNEIENLRAANERAQAQLGAPTPPAPPRILAHWQKPQLVNAGYDAPQSAVQTVLGAMARNDPEALAASVTPLARTNLTREQWSVHGPPDEEVAKATQQIADSLTLDAGFDVVGENSPQPGLATVDVYFEGEGRARRFYLRNVAGQWKVDSLGGFWPGGTWSWP